MVRSRKSTLLVELSWVNFIVGWDWLRYCIKWFSSDGGPGQIHRIDVICVPLPQKWVLARSFSSSSAINMLA